MKSEIKAYLDSLNYSDKCDVYNYLRANQVKEDVIAYMQNDSIYSKLKEKSIEKIAESVARNYVYDDKSDLSLLYYDTLENLIRNHAILELNKQLNNKNIEKGD